MTELRQQDQASRPNPSTHSANRPSRFFSARKGQQTSTGQGVMSPPSGAAATTQLLGIQPGEVDQPNRLRGGQGVAFNQPTAVTAPSSS